METVLHTVTLLVECKKKYSNNSPFLEKETYIPIKRDENPWFLTGIKLFIGH